MPKVAFKEHEVRAWLEIPANARRLTDEESLDLSYRKMRYHRSTEYWQDVYLWQREIAPDAPDMRLLHLGIIPRWSWREHGVLRAPGNDERFDGTCYYQAKRTPPTYVMAWQRLGLPIPRGKEQEVWDHTCRRAEALFSSGGFLAQDPLNTPMKLVGGIAMHAEMERYLSLTSDLALAGARRDAAGHHLLPADVLQPLIAARGWPELMDAIFVRRDSDIEFYVRYLRKAHERRNAGAYRDKPQERAIVEELAREGGQSRATTYRRLGAARQAFLNLRAPAGTVKECGCCYCVVEGDRIGCRTPIRLDEERCKRCDRGMCRERAMQDAEDKARRNHPERFALNDSDPDLAP